MLPIKLCAATKNRLLEVDFLVIVYSGEQLFHLLLRGDTGVGTRTGIGNGVLRDLGQLLVEFLFVDDALLPGRSIKRAISA